VTTDRAADLAKLDEEVRGCPLCDLCKTRTHAVPGDGPVDAEVMFIGEGPGYHEDQRGHPFVGPAGRLLDELLAAIDLDRSKVYITNVVKCRPPGNRDPLPHEIEACAPYLERQLALIKPKVVVTLGRYSMARFFPGASISKIHGQPKRIDSTIYFPMYHPAAALHRSDLMATVKADMLKIPALLQEARTAPQDGADSPTAQEEAPVLLGLFYL
jgi:uracil-DNA glycosylase family 4